MHRGRICHHPQHAFTLTEVAIVIAVIMVVAILALSG
ncbi:MAG: hypothetical protein K0Q55_4073, partial [Verrucomicrobia bacterium]|nr:hypothetical protein [Verrucomicrobiota bacterium]